MLSRKTSDALKVDCDKGEKVCVAFALNCSDRKAKGARHYHHRFWDVRDLMVADVEHWARYANHLVKLAERITDNSSFYIVRDIGFVVRINSVRTLKRYHVRVSLTPDARTVIEQQPARLDLYNGVRLHVAYTTVRPANTSCKPRMPL